MRFLKSPRFSMLLPYLLLAIVVIIVWRIVTDISYVFSALSWFWGIILPFFYGFLLAYVLNIPCSALQKLYGRARWGFISRKRKGLGVVSVYLLFILFILLVLNLVIPQIYNSVAFFIANFQTYYDTAINFVGSIEHYIDMDLTGMIEEQLQPQNILNLLQGFMNDAFWGTLANVGTAIFRMFLALVSSIYILLSRDAFASYFRRMWAAIFPPRVSSATFKYAAALNHNFKRYLFTQTIDGLICGTLATIAMAIMGSPYALVLGIMIGLFNYIPYFGSIVATIIAILVVLLTQGLTMGLIATIVLIALQQLDANVIQPKLMSGSFSLSPLFIIISITLGGAFAGIFGMVVAIPIMAVLKDLFENYITYREWKRATASAADESVKDK